MSFRDFGISTESEQLTTATLPSYGNQYRCTRWFQIQNISQKTIRSLAIFYRTKGSKEYKVGFGGGGLKYEMPPGYIAEVDVLEERQAIVEYYYLFSVDGNIVRTPSVFADYQEEQYFRWVVDGLSDDGKFGSYIRRGSPV